MNLGIAISIAAKGFENSLDKGGQPYILHCLRVMNSLNTNDWELNAIAVLHDCVEDGVCTVDDLIKYRFSQRVIFSIITLTHDKSVSYDDYIKKIATDKDAVKVKLAD